MTNQWKNHDGQWMTMVSDKCCEWWQGVHSRLSFGLGCFRVATVGACWPNLQVTTIPRSKYDDSYSFFNWPLAFQWGHPSPQDLIHQQDVAGDHRAAREIDRLFKLMTKKKKWPLQLLVNAKNVPWMEELFLDAVIVPHTCFSCHHGLSWKSQRRKDNNFTCWGWKRTGMFNLKYSCIWCIKLFILCVCAMVQTCAQVNADQLTRLFVLRLQF